MSHDDADDAPAWDADDPRRRNDQFAPPTEPCECHCLHCGRTFSSEGIWFQKVINDPSGFEGFWMCPTPNCGGAGFTFDIFPTDPAHPANEGWHSFDDEDYVEDEGDAGELPEADAGEDEWDPDESKYKALDEIGDDAFGGDDEDLEGEEWKHGLQPGQHPEGTGGDLPDAMECDEGDDDPSYDQPDERPRVIDWSDRPNLEGPAAGEGGARPTTDFGEDDIPF